MKLERITEVKQLKAGLYIRAPINLFGAHWVEVVRVNGVPKRVSTNGSKHKSWKVNVGEGFPVEYYVSDIGVNGRYSFLFKFSNKALEHLKRLSLEELFAVTRPDASFEEATERRIERAV